MLSIFQFTEYKTHCVLVNKTLPQDYILYQRSLSDQHSE